MGSDYVRNLVNFRFDTKATTSSALGLNVRFNDQVAERVPAPPPAAGSNVTSRLRNAVQYQPAGRAQPRAGARPQHLRR